MTLTKHQKYQKLSKTFEVPMVLLGFVYLTIFIIRISFHLSQTQINYLDALDFVIWMSFVSEYILLLYYANDPLRFAKTHLLDLLIILVPVLRILRSLAILSLFQTSASAEQALMGITRTMYVVFSETRVVFVTLYLARTVNNLRKFIIRNKLRYIVLFVFFLVIFLGAAGAFFERQDPRANIVNTYEGVWWGITSITTVGYGDRYPVTLPGRIIAVGLMTIGLGLFSLVTADLAYFLVGKHEDQDKKEILEKIAHLEAKIDKYRADTKKAEH